jgi:hypothetical protein
MKQPRISIAGLMVAVALLALGWYMGLVGVESAEKLSRHNLSLCYSWAPDRGGLPEGEPTFSDYVPLLDTEEVTTGLSLLALGASPMASLLGLGIVMLVRGLFGRGECSPFLFGFLGSGAVALFGYAVAAP